MGSTLAEKIYARAAGLARAPAGTHVAVRPDHVLGYDFPGYSDRLFDTLARFGMDTPARLREAPRESRVMFIDHLTTRRSPRIDAVHAQTRQAASRFGFTLHEGEGIGHLVMCERGLAQPGALLVHFDSHVAAAGAHGALGIGIGESYEVAWVTGWWHTTVPTSVRVDLSGQLPPGVDARDIVHELVRTLPPHHVAGAVLELDGQGLRTLSGGQREVICGLAVFTGALTAVCLGGDSGGGDDAAARADAGAAYGHAHALDLAKLEPLVALPGSSRPDHIVPIGMCQGEPVTRAFVGSCASGRIDDLRSVAAVLRGRRVAPGVRLIVAPSSEAVRRQAVDEGLMACFEAAGAEVGAASCDYCYGFAEPLQDGDACISCGTLNVPGRMGSAAARIFLASPATVAASAVAGRIADPRSCLDAGMLR